MKNIITTLLGALLTFSIASPCFCAPDSAGPGKSLILYYSLSGYTRHVAGILQELTGADLAEIKTVDPYPDDFHAVVEQARDERSRNYLPPVQPLNVDLNDYTTIYLGFPIWSNSIPQPMHTFLSGHSLAGKTIVPFCTHDGYGPGRSFRVVAEYCPEARVLDGFDMLGSEARDARQRLASWLNRLDLNPSQSSERTVPISITIADTRLSGELGDGPAARAFRSMLPLSITMTGYGGREYYGGIDKVIETPEQGQLRFHDGDITYCPQNNTVAIFYAQTSRPDLTMEVIPMGRVTSSLAPLHDLDRTVTVTFATDEGSGTH